MLLWLICLIWIFTQIETPFWVVLLAVLGYGWYWLTKK